MAKKTIEIKDEYDFKNLEYLCLGKAVDVLNEISNANKSSEFMSYLKKIFNDYIPTSTEVNDFITYDWESIYENIGMPLWNELSYLCDSQLVENGIKEMEIFLKELDKEDTTYEIDKESGEITLNALEHLEAEIDKSVNNKEITEDLSIIIETLDSIDAWMLNKKLKGMIRNIVSWISDHK